MNYSKLPPEDMIFEIATVEDAEDLSAVAVRSKRHWGYSKEAMELWNQNLTITEDFLNSHTVIKATLEDEIVGFFALEEIQPVTRIAQYWIDTPYMRKGYGTVMYNYLRDYLKKRNVEKVTLVLDPNGMSFFERKGAKILERIEHKVKNKFLYIVEVPVN
ncbi:GNAT family N-acetyltransferase [Moheibacter sp.]|uniref:GNAT family N-acetyltransferase n=1 Tax=Moheibacter sp. TaxID=1965316 RepID=UPI003C74B7C6